MDNTLEFGIFWGKALFECALEHKPLIDKFLYYGDRMVLSAKPKQGKTVLIMQLVSNLTTGKPFLDTYKIDKPCNVLYIQAEGSRGDTKKRFANMGKQIELDKKRLFHINKRGLGLQRKADIDTIKELAARPNVKYDVIILDPLYKLLHGGDLNSNRDAIAWTNHVDEFIGNYNATGIIVHHDTEKEFIDKNGNKHKPSETTLFGSSFWSGFVTHTYKLTSHKGIHYLRSGIQRSGEMIERQEMRMITPQKDKLGRLFFTATATDLEVSLGRFKIEEVLKKHGKVVYPDIYEEAGVSCSHFHRVIKDIEFCGNVESHKDDQGKVWYTWKNPIK